MNNWNGLGRLTRDPEVRYSTGKNGEFCVARYTLAIDRRIKTEGGPTADFIPCVAMGKMGEFAEKWFKQGVKIAVTGSIQTGSYTNKEGQKVYTTEILVSAQEFAESKSSGGSNNGQNNTSRNASNTTPQQPSQADEDGFMSIPDGIEDDLPFK